jgi:hypothetical protein
MRSTTAACRFPGVLHRAALLALAAAVATACGGGSSGQSGSATVPSSPSSGDPGTEEWQPIPPSQVADACGLDPDLLAAADAEIDRSWAVVRYGQLCHEHYPEDREQVDERTEIFSASKTFGALVTGVAAYQTRDLPRSGRKTGPLSDEDRVDHWLDEFSFNPDAQIAHVLAMVAHNPDLSWGAKRYQYDLDGRVQINRLSDVLNTVVAQDPERLGADLEEFTQRHVYAPLGMRDSVWSGGDDDKIFAYSLSTTVRDMARIGLLLLHGGVWSGERILDEDWVYKMTHAAFEDSNLSYGYLTWLDSPASDPDGSWCAPLAVQASYPHGLSEATDCGAEPPRTCQQQFDVGLWYAAGLFGQYIIGHRGLDLVLVVKNFDPKDPIELWHAVRPALVALDPTFAGDESGFCESYSRGDYAPDL